MLRVLAAAAAAVAVVLVTGHLQTAVTPAPQLPLGHAAQNLLLAGLLLLEAAKDCFA
jgi:hypothetical protein